MKRTYTLVFAAAWLLLLAHDSQADVIYAIQDYPTWQEGHSLSGSITTTDDASVDGLLATAEVLDWSFTVTGPNGFSGSKTANSLNPISGSVGVSSTEITIGFPPDEMGVNELNLNSGSSPGSPMLRYLLVNDIFGAGIIEQYEAIGSELAWQTFPGTGSGELGGDPWVVAKVVPEPSTSCLVSWIVIALLIRRRASSGGF